MLSGAFVFAFLAGIFSTLSPCVLPLLPIVLGAAISESRMGPVALACGLALSFVGIGLFLATAGHAIGLDQGALRTVGAFLLIAVGLVLAVPVFSARFVTAAGPVSGWADDRFGGFETSGLRGQFALGLLLGLVWSPCVGPTLGAASIVAAQGKDLGQVALTMAVFGLGAALPLLVLGTLSRDVMLRWRDKIRDAGKGGKVILGVLLIAVGLFVITGFDKHVEALLVNISPDWLTELTTRY